MLGIQNTRRVNWRSQGERPRLKNISKIPEMNITKKHKQIKQLNKENKSVFNFEICT